MTILVPSNVHCLDGMFERIVDSWIMILCLFLVESTDLDYRKLIIDRFNLATLVSSALFNYLTQK